MISNKGCFGCRNCEKICNQKAIKITDNEEGFLYPIIDNLLCNNCRLCETVCPTINYSKTLNLRDTQKIYAGYTYDLNQRCTSSSGGIFATIADYILENGGVVIGACFTEDFHLYHIVINNKRDLDRLKGSKYFQSDLTSVFEEILENLKKDKLVYFCGTPCQVSALKLFLKKDYNNLITSDLICHGVPSKLYFYEYKSFLEKKYRGKLQKFQFRNYKGWGELETFHIKTKKRILIKKQPQYCSPFLTGFLSGALFREVCYSCVFSNGTRCGDITLGDFWGIQKISNLDYEKGCSAILVNTQKGQEILETLKKNLYLEQRSFQEVSSGNPNLLQPTKRPEIRENIYCELKENTINYIFNKYFKIHLYFFKSLKYYIGVCLGDSSIKKILRRILQK